MLSYSVLLEDPTEVDLVQADGGWKLCYSTSATKDWIVVNLGSFHNEGELLIAADDRWAELLEVAGVGTRNDFVATAVTTGRFSRRLQLDAGLMPPTSWSLTPVSTLFNCRADLAKSPGAGAIYLTPQGNAVSLRVAEVPGT